MSVSTSININTLTQRLTKHIKTVSYKILDEKAKLLVTRIHNEAKYWKQAIRRRLSTPSISRGYEGRYLKRHSSPTQNASFPMMDSGDLRRSLQYRVRQYKIADGIAVVVNRTFTALDKNGRDYGEELNKKHHLLKGFKERAYALLDERIRELV